MFTGLIEEKGKVLSLKQEGTNLHIEIGASKILSDASIGDSIAVDGACLTVTEILGHDGNASDKKIESLKDPFSFKVTAIDETLNLTTLRHLQVGTPVNLERCVSLADRLGGHIVSGHVDGIGTIQDIKDLDGSKEFYIETPRDLGRYIIHKGSIAVSGISLTVAFIDQDGSRVKAKAGSDYIVFSVAIIPKTLEATTLGDFSVGDEVNIEVDQVAKYIENFKLYKT